MLILSVLLDCYRFSPGTSVSSMYIVILSGELIGEQQIIMTYNRDIKHSANTGVVQILELMLIYCD